MDKNNENSTKKDITNEKINVELGGMAIYGATSNKEIGGYESSGDLENAGHPERGFKRPEDGNSFV